ncbi:putative membrane protein, predicted efflux pump [Handroanthus impetiginosus]|uniref:Protein DETOXIFICATION n=1 Tax=Handroanthus impetiginosus TaxID=429701 RepID=A0A2G9G9N3_9LAMI|nr:putative membrane protein, predicted efflux pump [Handroanthus impetiginosus]
MGEESKVPLLKSENRFEDESLGRRVLVESKMLWRIIGPAILSRLSTYSYNVISQAFAGHIGDTELAAISVIISVITGFDFGLLLGMASALETLCGQAYGAKQYHMLGVYMQRSWIVLLGIGVLLLPLYIFAGPLLLLLGQPKEVADMAGYVALWLIPLHFSFAFIFPMQRFLQCQVKNAIYAWSALAGLVVHVAVTWLFVRVLGLGVVGVAATLNISWWVFILGMLIYIVGGGCPGTWTGFSMEAFSGLWEFMKLSASSGIMLCLENWYYRILVLMTGNMKDAAIAVDALSVCVRVANELGAGNGKGAKFATLVSVVTSTIIGVVAMIIVLIFHQQIALFFSSSKPVLDAVSTMTVLLALTILLNSIQPVLSGVAVGSGWQSRVAYINVASYYMVGLPLGILMQCVFDMGVMGVWAGMIFGGTALQTIILIVITMRCDWEKEAERARKHVKKWSEV